MMNDHGWHYLVSGCIPSEKYQPSKHPKEIIPTILCTTSQSWMILAYWPSFTSSSTTIDHHGQTPPATDLAQPSSRGKGVIGHFQIVICVLTFNIFYQPSDGIRLLGIQLRRLTVTKREGPTSASTYPGMKRWGVSISLVSWDLHPLQLAPVTTDRERRGTCPRLPPRTLVQLGFHPFPVRSLKREQSFIHCWWLMLMKNRTSLNAIVMKVSQTIDATMAYCYGRNQRTWSQAFWER